MARRQLQGTDTRKLVFPVTVPLFLSAQIGISQSASQQEKRGHKPLRPPLVFVNGPSSPEWLISESLQAPSHQSACVFLGGLAGLSSGLSRARLGASTGCHEEKSQPINECWVSLVITSPLLLSRCYRALTSRNSRFPSLYFLHCLIAKPVPAQREPQRTPWKSLQTGDALEVLEHARREPCASVGRNC